MITANLKDKFDGTSLISSSPVSGFYNYQRPTLTNPAIRNNAEKSIFADRKVSEPVIKSQSFTKQLFSVQIDKLQ
jgi:hypothetical protein